MDDWYEYLDEMERKVTRDGGNAGAVLAGRYRVVRQLGRGGMGSVWLAEDAQLDNLHVAIKMLPPILVANKRAYNQLKAEALVSLKLSHTNIVTLRAFEENDGNPFLVMDYVDGRTLDDLLAEKGTLTEAETVALLTPVAAALDYAHSKGVVHRDVKPGNVMIDKDGTPLVLDFGIAREAQETLTQVTGKQSSGTLSYMSPEQLNGAAPKPAQDVYSFAAMVYECLTGKPPFCRGQIEYQILNNPPEPLTGGTRFCASVMSGLAKIPTDRPASCAAVLGNENGQHGIVPQAVEVVSPSSASPTPKRAVDPTELNAVNIRADARITRKRLERLSDEDGFGERKSRLDEAFVRADTFFDSRLWNEAIQQFTEYVERCEELVKLDEHRNDAKSKCMTAERMREESSKASAPEYAHAEWIEASSLLTEGKSAFDKMEFEVASKMLNEAILKFHQCATLATKIRTSILDAPAKANTFRKEIQYLADEDGFRDCKDEAEQLYQRAEKESGASNWNEAIRLFTEYIQKCSQLMKSDAERKDAKAKRDEANKAKNVAFSVGAATSVLELWAEAEKRMTEAGGEFGKMRFTAAAFKFQEATEAFRKCTKVTESLPLTKNIAKRKKIKTWFCVLVAAGLLALCMCRYFSSELDEPIEGVLPGSVAGEVKTVTLPGGAKMRFCWCPPGTFMMGKGSNAHRVTLTKGFWIGETEVTQAQWESVMGNNPSSFKGTDRPVEQVSWNDCQKFIRKVNVALKGGIRLPTEAEWEYACRAGTSGDYGGTGNLEEMGWYSKNSGETTHPVAQKKPNAWGLYDMHGNVWEWCADWHGDYPSGEVTDPTGPRSGSYRVSRGGSWQVFFSDCRSAYRSGWGPDNRNNFIGFRIVCSMMVSKGKTLSEAEIRKALQMGARNSITNQIPQKELERCVSLVRDALYQAWKQPSVSEAGCQPAHLEICLDLSGRITSYQIVKSSGDAIFDQSVVKAALNTETIRGLSEEFLKQFERLTIEFKLK